MPWDLAWQQALYGPDGFYRATLPAAHFATPAQGVPGGTPVLAEALVALARQHDLAQVVEVGSGGGELLAEILALAPDLRLTAVEVAPTSQAVRSPGPACVRWLAAPGGAGLPDELTQLESALVLAVEWLDVVPCPMAQVGRSGVPLRVEVEVGSGRERLADPLEGPDLAWAERYWPVRRAAAGARVEIGRTRDRAFADLVGRVASGLVVAVDYGHRASERPAFGSLTGYREGGQVAAVPDGTCDLTAHVAIDSLATTRLARQRDILGDLAPSAGRPDHALAATDPPAYLAALSREAAHAALRARNGLGGFWWALHEVVACAPTGQ